MSNFNTVTIQNSAGQVVDLVYMTKLLEKTVRLLDQVKILLLSDGNLTDRDLNELPESDTGVEG
jgi:hypothetical protein